MMYDFASGGRSSHASLAICRHIGSHYCLTSRSAATAVLGGGNAHAETGPAWGMSEKSHGPWVCICLATCSISLAIAKLYCHQTPHPQRLVSFSFLPHVLPLFALDIRL